MHKGYQFMRKGKGNVSLHEGSQCLLKKNGGMVYLLGRKPSPKTLILNQFNSEVKGFGFTPKYTARYIDPSSLQ